MAVRKMMYCYFTGCFSNAEHDYLGIRSGQQKRFESKVLLSLQVPGDNTLQCSTVMYYFLFHKKSLGLTELNPPLLIYDPSQVRHLSRPSGNEAAKQETRRPVTVWFHHAAGADGTHFQGGNMRDLTRHQPLTPSVGSRRTVMETSFPRLPRRRRNEGLAVFPSHVSYIGGQRA